jgi:putative lipoic acid-binding regulatory protein
MSPSQPTSQPPGDTPEAERARALELLRATHKFPVDYHLSVITLTGEEVALRLREAVEAVRALAGDAYRCIPSSAGKYTSHRFTIRLESAEEVLDLYARVRAVDGVITVF